MAHVEETKHEERKHEIKFTIDGEEFETQDRRQPARSLLRLAGLDPSNYDLGELEGHSPKPKVFHDDQEVEIRPGSRFVSIRTGPAPVE